MAEEGVKVSPLPLSSLNLLFLQFGGLRRDIMPILFLNIIEFLFYFYENSNL